MSDPVRSVTGSVESDAEPEVVADLLHDASRIPEWAPDFADVVTPRGSTGARSRATPSSA